MTENALKMPPFDGTSRGWTPARQAYRYQKWGKIWEDDGEGTLNESIEIGDITFSWCKNVERDYESTTITASGRLDGKQVSFSSGSGNSRFGEKSVGRGEAAGVKQLIANVAAKEGITVAEFVKCLDYFGNWCVKNNLI